MTIRSGMESFEDHLPARVQEMGTIEFAGLTGHFHKFHEMAGICWASSKGKEAV